jgi:phage baseplate assembly protein W
MTQPGMTIVTGARAPGPRADLTTPLPPRHLDEPMRVDGSGRTARTDDDDHVRDLIRAVLFTEPFERPNRPDFGCAMRTMVFLPNHEVLASATKALVQGALQKWLETEILVVDVQVEAVDAQLQVTIVYQRRSDGGQRRETFRGYSGPVS